jgi:hypothetical protein
VLDRRIHRRASIPIAVLAGVLLLPGGCPVQFAADRPAADIAAGSYWVDVHGGALAYFELPDTRDPAGQWRSFAEESLASVSGASSLPQWFTGPAFYDYSPQSGWSRDQSRAGLTLDEAIQLLDAPPSP